MHELEQLYMSMLEQQHHNEIHRMHKQNNKHDHEYV